MAYVTQLSNFEMELAGLVASTRNSEQKTIGAKPLAGQDEAATGRDHLTGAKGELAVARLFCLYPNFQTYPEARAAGGYDFPHRISVKSSSRHRWLLARPGHDSPDARYVAAFVEGATVTILGWAPGESVFQERWLSAPDPLRPPCFVVRASFLQPLPVLFRIIAVERVLEAPTGEGALPPAPEPYRKPVEPGALERAMESLAALRRNDPALVKWIEDGYPTLTEVEHLQRFGKPHSKTSPRAPVASPSPRPAETQSGLW
jgi:hypothetical protein